MLQLVINFIVNRPLVTVGIIAYICISLYQVKHSFDREAEWAPLGWIVILVLILVLVSVSGSWNVLLYCTPWALLALMIFAHGIVSINEALWIMIIAVIFDFPKEAFAFISKQPKSKAFLLIASIGLMVFIFISLGIASEPYVFNLILPSYLRSYSGGSGGMIYYWEPARHRFFEIAIILTAFIFGLISTPIVFAVWSSVHSPEEVALFASVIAAFAVCLGILIFS